jgi:hypothetical protein
MPARLSKPKPQPMEGEMTMRQAVAARMQAKLHEPANWMMGHASFEIDGKVYCFVTRDGSLAMKLPETRIAPMLEDGDAKLLSMGSRTMREWLVVPESGSAATLKLLSDAKAYVASLPAKAKRKPAAKKSAAKKSGSKQGS